MIAVVHGLWFLHGDSQMSSITHVASLLLPTNEVCGGYISQVSVCPRRCLPHCMLGYTPGQAPPRQTPSTVHAGIQSTSGQYASHWNVFLLDIEMFANQIPIVFVVEHW